MYQYIIDIIPLGLAVSAESAVAAAEMLCKAAMYQVSVYSPVLYGGGITAIAIVSKLWFRAAHLRRIETFEWFLQGARRLR